MPPMDFAQTRNLEVIAKNEIFLNRFNGEKILLLSPNIHDFLFWKKLLPNADFTISTKFDWDLEEKLVILGLPILMTLGLTRQSSSFLI